MSAPAEPQDPTVDTPDEPWRGVATEDADEVDAATGAFHRGDPDGVGHAIVSINPDQDLLCV